MSEFVSYLSEVFYEFGDINSRKMFGGFGIYHQGLMFGLVADDELYLKADATSLPEYERNNCSAFEYTKNNKTFKMSYYLAPEIIYDDPEEAKKWADLAYQSAVRQKKTPKSKKS